MDESLEGLLWLLSQIEGNAGIMASLTSGIWPVQAPVGTAPIYGVITPAGGHDIAGVADIRKMFEGPYQVRVWGYANQSDTLQVAMNAIDGLLQPNGVPSRGTSPDGNAQIIHCARENPLPLLPDWDGQQLRIGVGGLYRLQIQRLH